MNNFKQIFTLTHHIYVILNIKLYLNSFECFSKSWKCHRIDILSRTAQQDSSPFSPNITNVFIPRLSPIKRTNKMRSDIFTFLRSNATIKDEIKETKKSNSFDKMVKVCYTAELINKTKQNTNSSLFEKFSLSL